MAPRSRFQTEAHIKIYVGGTFTAQQRLRAEADTLRNMGHEIVSSWLHEISKPEHLTQDQWDRRLAQKDVAEVFASDCIVTDLDETSTTGGRYTEWGVACHPLAMQLRYTVGSGVRPNGCFQQLADGHFETWDLLRTYFRENHGV